MNLDKEIKTETPSEDVDDYREYGNGGPTSCLSPNHPDLRPDDVTEGILENRKHLVKTSTSSVHLMEDAPGPPEMKPTWFPSSKGRSIVWEHITWQAETQRAACNYCSAEFQIKGGTSALLRHLKTIHPAAINFDPENPPPVARRRRKKMEDYTIVTEDTKSYMDNLLEQFLQDENAPRDEQNMNEEGATAPTASVLAQSRADSEIDEVIRNLQKETAQNGGEEPEQDQDLRRILGIDDQPAAAIPVEVSAINSNCPPPSTAFSGNDGGAEEEEMRLPTTSSAKKRKAEVPPIGPDTFKHGKLSLSLMSSIRRPTPQSIGQHPSHVGHSHLPTPPPILTSSGGVGTSSGGNGATTAGIAAKYNANAVGLLDLEAKVLYNQSMHSTIAREDAMAAYYRMKSRKLELEIKKLEKECGEETRVNSPIDEQDD